MALQSIHFLMCTATGSLSLSHLSEVTAKKKIFVNATKPDIFRKQDFSRENGTLVRQGEFPLKK